MIRFFLLAIALIMISCESTKREVLLRKDLDEKGVARFYHDFNIFSRQGVDEIVGDTLKRPFFKVHLQADSSIRLTVYKKEGERQAFIPKDDSLLYDFDDISDGPRHHYYRIFKDSLVVYGYQSKIDEIRHWPDDSTYLSDLIPMEVQILTQDTLYIFFQRCFRGKIGDGEDSDVKIPRSDFLKYAVLPFSKAVDLNCKDCLVHYFDSTGKMRHYYRHYEVNEPLGKKNPGDGLFGYKKEFTFWRDYYLIF